MSESEKKLKTLAEFKAELKAELRSEFDTELKRLEAGYGELKASLKSRTMLQHHHGDHRYAQEFTTDELRQLGLK